MNDETQKGTIEFEIKRGFRFEIEEEMVKVALRHCFGHREKTANLLNVTRRTLRHLLEKYDIDSKEYYSKEQKEHRRKYEEMRRRYPDK